MTLTQITHRGQLTLPVEIRKALGLTAGAAVEVSIEAGRIVIQPVIALPVRIYSDEDLAMFDEAQHMTAAEMKEALGRWDERGPS